MNISISISRNGHEAAFATSAEFTAAAMGWPGDRLVRIWDKLAPQADLPPVRRWYNNQIGIASIWRAAELVSGAGNREKLASALRDNAVLCFDSIKAKTTEVKEDSEMKMNAKTSKRPPAARPTPPAPSKKAAMPTKAPKGKHPAKTTEPARKATKIAAMPAPAPAAASGTDPRIPAPGTKLKRDFGGKQVEILVESPESYRYAGKAYKSLSAVAREIAGGNRNGYTFFGLGAGKPRQPDFSDPAVIDRMAADNPEFAAALAAAEREA